MQSRKMPRTRLIVIINILSHIVASTEAYLLWVNSSSSILLNHFTIVSEQASFSC